MERERKEMVPNTNECMDGRMEGDELLSVIDQCYGVNSRRGDKKGKRFSLEECSF